MRPFYDYAFSLIQVRLQKINGIMKGQFLSLHYVHRVEYF